MIIMYELYGSNSGAKIKIIMNYKLQIMNYFICFNIILQLPDLQTLKNVRQLL